MRVIAGTARGCRLVAPPGERVRPTADRVKEALFSSVQPRLRGASVGDLYAGSGALGIEALSRGARHATFVEQARPALAVLRTNLATTRLAEHATVVASDVRRALEVPLPGAPFDLVLLDPPYDVAQEELAAVLAALRPQLAAGGLVVVERGRRGRPPAWPAGVLPGRVRRYGDTVLHAGHVPDTEEPT